MTLANYGPFAPSTTHIFSQTESLLCARARVCVHVCTHACTCAQTGVLAIVVLYLADWQTGFSVVDFLLYAVGLFAFIGVRLLRVVWGRAFLCGGVMSVCVCCVVKSYLYVCVCVLMFVCVFVHVFLSTEATLYVTCIEEVGIRQKKQPNSGKQWQKVAKQSRQRQSKPSETVKHRRTPSNTVESRQKQ